MKARDVADGEVMVVDVVCMMLMTVMKVLL
jgi:hypothetical protein